MNQVDITIITLLICSALISTTAAEELEARVAKRLDEQDAKLAEQEAKLTMAYAKLTEHDAKLVEQDTKLTVMETTLKEKEDQNRDLTEQLNSIMLSLQARNETAQSGMWTEMNVTHTALEEVIDNQKTINDTIRKMNAEFQANRRLLFNVTHELVNKRYGSNAFDGIKRRAITQGCFEGNLELVEWLMDCGEEFRTADYGGMTPLETACSRGHLAVAELLIKRGVDIKGTFSPLDRACENGHLPVVHLLIEKGADVNIPNNFGYTAMHFACKKNHLGVAQLLIERGADVNAPSNDGNTPLHYAAIGSHLEVAELLLRSGADKRKKNMESKSPLDLARDRDNMKFIQLLQRFK